MKMKITPKKFKISKQMHMIVGIMIIMFGSNAHAQTYCIPLLDCSDDDVIFNVTLSTLSNPSGCSTGYSDFTALGAPTLVAGTTYPIAVTVGDGWSTEAVSVWIDYNSNGTFESSEFTSIGVGSGSTVSGNIGIPGTATPGNKRMRVRVAAVGGISATSDMACDEEDEYGETEDYTVNIQAAAGVNDFKMAPLFVYKSGNAFTIDSPSQLIDEVQLHDISGKSVFYKSAVSANSLAIDVTSFSNQLLILKIKTVDGMIQVKKIIN